MFRSCCLKTVRPTCSQAVVFLTLAAAAVLAGIADASDVGRRARRREKRDFDAEFGPSSTVGFGTDPFPASGRDPVAGRDFVSGLGRSSGLKYGPGLGLSSPSMEEEEDLAPAPSSAAPVGRSTGRAVAGTTPRFATAARPVPVYVPAPYPAPLDGPVGAADPFVVAAISYGPSDPGSVAPVAGRGPFAAGRPSPFSAYGPGGPPLRFDRWRPAPGPGSSEFERYVR